MPGVSMKLENQKHIDAPKSIVWSVTEDVERWPEWTPTVESIKRLDEGPFTVGSTALIKQPGMSEAKWRVTALAVGEGFSWETSIRGIHIVATHEMSTADGGTQSVLRVETSGIVAVLMWPLIRVSAPRSLAQENAALKAHCEALVPAS